MITIDLTAGQRVFWLSSKGFSDGWIKTIHYEETFYPPHEKIRTELSYFLTCFSYADMYMGDKVPRELIFTDYKEMVKYYSELPINT